MVVVVVCSGARLRRRRFCGRRGGDDRQPGLVVSFLLLPCLYVSSRKERVKRTKLLLNLAITASAPSLLSNTISAITIGVVFNNRQLVTSPPYGVMALSISAAVVPGAKFCAITTNGPANPRMLIPGLNLPPAAGGGKAGLPSEGASDLISADWTWAVRRCCCCCGCFLPPRLPAAGREGSVIREARELLPFGRGEEVRLELL